MASTQRCLASLARLSLSAPSRVRPSPAVSTIPNFLLPSVAAPQQVRYATIIKKRTKKKRTFKTFRTWDLSSIEQYSLCDAVRYVCSDNVHIHVIVVLYTPPMLTAVRLQLSPCLRGWKAACHHQVRGRIEAQDTEERSRPAKHHPPTIPGQVRYARRRRLPRG